METIGVVVAHDDRSVVEQVAEAIEASGELFVASTSPSSAAPGTVMVAGGGVLARLEPAGVPVVALAGRDLVASARAALAAGARDIVRWPEERDRLIGAVRRAAAPEQTGARGRVIVVAGARGGVGASTVAACLGARLGEAVVLDLDPAGCGQRAFCAEEPARTLHDVAADPSPESLDAALVPHAGGARACHPAPWRALPPPASLAAVVRSARALAPHVIVDASPGAVAAVAQDATVLLAVVGNDVGSVRGARVLLERAPGSWRFVVRRVRRAGVPLRDLTAALGSAPVAVVPFDAALARACDLGRMPARATRAARTIAKLERALEAGDGR